MTRSALRLVLERASFLMRPMASDTQATWLTTLHRRESSYAQALVDGCVVVEVGQTTRRLLCPASSLFKATQSPLNYGTLYHLLSFFCPPHNLSTAGRHERPTLLPRQRRLAPGLLHLLHAEAFDFDFDFDFDFEIFQIKNKSKESNPPPSRRSGSKSWARRVEYSRAIGCDACFNFT